jgi:anti-sigma regulatory factor (Ser/Thr protein kinase)
MTSNASDREQQTFEAVPTSARAARRFVSDTLRAHGAGLQLIKDFALVVSELATNIIEHGDGSRLVIYLDVADPQWWELEVVGGATTAPSQLRDPDTWTVAGVDNTSGRGLGIVRRLMHDITTGSTAGQFSIRCRRIKTAAEQRTSSSKEGRPTSGHPSVEDDSTL